MRWRPQRHIPWLVSLSLVVAAAGLVIPWWTVGDPQTRSAIAPFAAGGAGPWANEGAVVAVGVLVLVGLLGLVGGLVLRLRGESDGALEAAGWVWIGGGGFLLVAPLTAVLTWPAGGLSFWTSAEASQTGFAAGAAWGWYLTLVAGAMAAVAGLAWLLLPAHQRD